MDSYGMSLNWFYLSCFKENNMIKKCLKGLCIALLTLLPISFASASVYTGSLPGTIYNTSMPNYPFTNTIDRNLNFRTNNDLKNFFYTADCSITSDCRGARSWILFRNNSKLAGYGNVNTDSTHRVIVQGYYNSYCSSTLADFASYCYPGITTAGNYTTSIDNFYSLGAVYDSYYFNNDHLTRPYLCFLSNSSSLASCFTINVGNNSSDYNGYISGSYILTSNGNNLTDFSSESSKFQSSPLNYTNPNVPGTGSNGIDGSVVGETTTGAMIDYFEDNPYYKFNIDMCYIGTRDIVSVYEDRIPYYQGSGYTIFDFYSKLYNVNSFQITQVGTFINTRYINFATWFGGENRSAITGDPLYNAYYTYGSGFRLDQGSGLTNPFLGNLSAFYFLGSVYDALPSLSNTPGEELATYCYKKLYTAKGTPSNDGSTYVIDDNHNQAYDYNTNQRQSKRERHGVLFSGNLILDSKSWDGTPLDYFDSDAGNDMDFNSFFSNAFNKFKYSFGEMTPGDFGVGYLPGYIILFLLAIIFFRFLSH